LRDGLMHALSQCVLDGFELGPHAVAVGLANQQEAALFF
jgi:hypothetical protein